MSTSEYEEPRQSSFHLILARYLVDRDVNSTEGLQLACQGRPFPGAVFPNVGIPTAAAAPRAPLSKYEWHANAGSL